MAKNFSIKNYLKTVDDKIITSDTIKDHIKDGEGATVFNLNLYAVSLLVDNKDFFRAIDNADYLNVDGVGASILLFFLYGKWIQPIGYKYWMPGFLSCGISKKIFIFGGAENESIIAINKLRAMYPQHDFEGCHGYVDDNEFVESQDLSNYDYVIVGISMPKQEIIIDKFLCKIYQNTVFFSCGGWIKQVSGIEKPVPKIFQSLYLEWLYRSLHRPGHLKDRVICPILKIIRNF